MSAKYKSPSFLLPNELNTSANPANDTGINSLYSMDFNGSSDSINVGSTTITGSCSISLWFKTSANISLANLTGGVGMFQYLGIQNNKLVAYVYPNFVPLYGSTVNDGLWHNFVFAYDSTTSGGPSLGTFRAYVDGALTITYDMSSGGQSYAINTIKSIGAYDGGSQRFFNGQIDEVAVFNRTLNTTEIAALYDGTGSNIRPSNLMATNLNPVTYYPLGEQAQNTGYVGSGNPGNPNTLSNVWQFPNGVLQDYVMDFNGGDVIDTEYQILSKPFSISFWFNTITTSFGAFIGTGQAGSGSQSGVNCRINDDGTVDIQVGGTQYKSTSTYNDGNWHNYLAVVSGSTAYLYIDNILQVSGGSIPTPADTRGLVIGGHPTETNQYNFIGKLSNVAIWNTDQSTNRANIYNNGSPQTTYTVSPQNWWKLNSTSVYTPSAPNYTKALDFDGSSDYIDYSNPSSLNIDENITVSAWFKNNGTAEGQIISKGVYTGEVGSGFPYVINVRSNGGIAWQYYGTNTQGSTSGTRVYILSPTSGASAVDYRDNAWHHVVGTKNGVNSKLYIDGVLITDLSQGGTERDYMVTNTSPVRIGASSSGTGEFTGKISNVAIWDSALTASQVSTLFNFGTPQDAISFSPISWWKLNNTTTGIQDSGSASNNGTNNGATQVNTSVAFVPSWKIPSALPITTTPNYTTALDFNADHISFGNSIGDSIGDNYTDGFTVSFWINPTTTGNDDGVFTFPGGISFVVRGNDFRLYNNGEKFSFDYGTNPNKEWSHCILSFLPSGSVFYVNSIPVKNWTYTDLDLDGKDLEVGRYAGENVYSFIGQLSNFQIWKTNLSSAEASTLYNNGTPIADLSGIPQSSSLISWWKLDTGGSTITDSAGSNNGTNSNPGAIQIASDVLAPQPVNGVSTTLPSTALQQSDLQFDSPYSNFSLSFDGNDRITIPNTSNIFDFGTNDFTVSLWCEGDGVAASQYIIGSTGGIRIGRHANLPSGASGGARLRIGSALNTVTAITTSIDDGNWHNVIIKRESGGVSIFTDGQVQQLRLDNGTNVSTPYTMSNSIAIGASLFIGSYTYNQEFWIGKVDETAFWSVALTEAQVLEIYNSGRPKDLSSFSGTAPISWWRLGENAYFQDATLFLPNSITGAPNGNASTNNLEMISADAPGTYANGIGTNLAILDRVGDAAVSTSNSQSYNMIPSDISPYVPGYVGKQIANNFSMSFDGNDNYFATSSNIGISGNQSRTMSVWLKGGTANNSKGWPMAVAFGAGSNAKAMWIGGGPSTGVYWTFGWWGTTEDIYTNIRIDADNDWHLLTSTYDGTTAKGYIDGVEVASAARTINTTDSTLLIGKHLQDATYWTGEIDEIAIWDTALNAGQIYNDIYQPTKTATNKTADLENNPNLPTPVVWYRMGDN